MLGRQIAAFIVLLLGAASLGVSLFGIEGVSLELRLIVSWLVAGCVGYLYSRLTTGAGTFIVGEVNEKIPQAVRGSVDCAAIISWILLMVTLVLG